MGERPSVFDIKGALSDSQKQAIRKQLEGVAETDISKNFSEFDFTLEDEFFCEVREVFDEFTLEVFEKAAKREFLSPTEREVAVVNFEIALKKLFELAKQQDVERLDNLSSGESRTDFRESLLGQIAELEVALEDPKISEDERRSTKAERDRLLGIAKMSFFHDVASRSSGKPLSEDELLGHKESVDYFLTREPVAEKSGEFDPRVAAEKIVDEYNKTLIAHKIYLGLEAKYSEEEILEHLRGALPEAEEAVLRAAIKDGQAEFKKTKPAEAGKLKTYIKIMSALFRGKKTEAAGFALGTLVVGALAPLMPRFLGEYIHSGDEANLFKAALASIFSSVSQAELGLRFSNFLTERMFGGGELVSGVLTDIFKISPEGLSKTDSSILQKQVDRTLGLIQQTAEISVKEIGADLSRAIGLILSIVTRLGDPLLLVPVAMAIGINIALSKNTEKRAVKIQKEMNDANDEFFRSIGEALEIKESRGETVGVQEQILERCRVARKNYAKAVADFSRSGGLPMAIILAMDTLIANYRGLDQAAVTEAVVSSTQLSGAITSLVEKSSRLSLALQPVVELTNFVREFRQEGGEQPTAWAVELVDVEREGLVVPYLKINPGDLCVLVGESGSGKTTLLDTLTGFGVSRGIMQVDGRRWAHVDHRTYRDGLVVADQFYALGTKSLQENIVGSASFNKKAFEESLKTFGLDKTLKRVAAKRAKKTGKKINDPSKELVINQDFTPSGGERKRIAMAAIDYRLKVDPSGVKMIILDEPTAGINNPSDSRCVFECIAAWRRDFPDKTIIISNHDSRLFGTLPGDSRILGLDAELGELTQDETLDQARENLDAPFAQLFNE